MSPASSSPGIDETLRMLAEGTASTTGVEFFHALVESLCGALGSMGAWVAVYLPETRQLRAVAMKMGEEWLDGLVYPIDGSPCEAAIDEARHVLVPDRIVELYPHTPRRPQDAAVSYLGVPLLDVDGRVLGHLAALDDKPMDADPQRLWIFDIFAARAAAELRRMRTERTVHEREAQLSLLLDGAMDAILGLSADLTIELANAAAEKVFGSSAGELVGVDLATLLEPKSASRLRAFAQRLVSNADEPQSQWVVGGLVVTPRGRAPVQAEATVSRYVRDSGSHYTLVLRDVHDRIEAEDKIRSLTQRAEVLREQLDAAYHFDEIVGASTALTHALDDVARVAPLETSVLLLGETGVGKELFARAVHAASPRRERPLVTVNCAALPKDLLESELFGHEKGAFTGATSKRDGRFLLAHEGTLFLDEIGELPLPLQAKLLRVLQEGELQPVGSSRVQHVDVRIVAATNRDLVGAMRRGEFREDLYYRLSVFPIHIPPLRERGADIILIAERFLVEMQRRIGQAFDLDAAAKARLLAYNWPGNVRELRNVIERAAITSTPGHLNLDRALPQPAAIASPSEPSALGDTPIMTEAIMRDLERQNLLRALERTRWRVSGENGAATLLGMNASTLASRIRALGLQRQR